jgi:4-amino-4-deoxy-L-arabinose transferase-like glycosyltransferase
VRRLARALGLDDPWLLGLLGLGLALRAGTALLLDAGMRPRGDEVTYLAQAAALRETGALETGHFVRPPLYFVLLAAIGSVADLFGLRPGLAAKLLQALAGAAAAIPVYRCALRLGGRRVARFAAAFLLLDPTLIAYTHLLWPETFFLLLVAILFERLAGLSARGPLRIAGLGVLAGLALLLKPAFGLFTLLLAGHWLRCFGWRATLRLVLLFGGAAAVVVSPWLVRNQLRYGPSILLENQGPYNLWIGNDPAPPRKILEQWKALPDPLTRSRVASQRGLDAIVAAPGEFATRSGVRAANLWGLEFFVVRHIVIGGYGPTSREALLAAFWTIQAAYALALLCAALGLRSAWRDPTLRLLLVYAASFTAIVALMVTTTRFRVPFAFPLAIASGACLDLLLAHRWRRSDATALAAAVGLLAFSFTRPLFATLASGEFDRVGELARWSWRFFRY